MRRSSGRLRGSGPSTRRRLALPRSHLATALERLERLFRTLPEARDSEFTVQADPEIQVAMDPSDLEEVFGKPARQRAEMARRRIALTSTQGVWAWRGW